MKCPKCQFENPAGMKFCGVCGVGLEKTCPKCNSSNPPGFKFCGECGHNLTLPSEPTLKDLSFDEKMDKIQRYLPKGLTQKILAQRGEIEGERKQVTVIFCDMEGFTYLLELLSVKESGIDKIPMSPEGKKYRIIEALKRIVLKGSEVRPLIIAVEDLHWIDKSSEDAFKDLLANITGARVFLIFTYRPEFVHTWGSQSYHSQVTLNRLSNRESLTMAIHILGTPDSMVARKPSLSGPNMCVDTSV